MLKLTVTFELDEEQLRDIFENHEIKFSKKKVKEIQVALEEAQSDVQTNLEEQFEEIVAEIMTDLFDK